MTWLTRLQFRNGLSCYVEVLGRNNHVSRNKYILVGIRREWQWVERAWFSKQFSGKVVKEIGNEESTDWQIVLLRLDFRCSQPKEGYAFDVVSMLR